MPWQFFTWLVTGDWNGDGITKIGVYSDGDWYLDTAIAGRGRVHRPTPSAHLARHPNVTPVIGNW